MDDPVSGDRVLAFEETTDRRKLSRIPNRIPLVDPEDGILHHRGSEITCFPPDVHSEREQTVINVSRRRAEESVDGLGVNNRQRSFGRVECARRKLESLMMECNSEWNATIGMPADGFVAEQVASEEHVLHRKASGSENAVRETVLLLKEPPEGVVKLRAAEDVQERGDAEVVSNDEGVLAADDDAFADSNNGRGVLSTRDRCGIESDIGPRTAKTRGSGRVIWPGSSTKLLELCGRYLQIKDTSKPRPGSSQKSGRTQITRRRREQVWKLCIGLSVVSLVMFLFVISSLFTEDGRSLPQVAEGLGADSRSSSFQMRKDIATTFENAANFPPASSAQLEDSAFSLPTGQGTTLHGGLQLPVERFSEKFLLALRIASSAAKWTVFAMLDWATRLAANDTVKERPTLGILAGSLAVSAFGIALLRRRKRQKEEEEIHKQKRINFRKATLLVAASVIVLALTMVMYQRWLRSENDIGRERPSAHLYFPFRGPQEGGQDTNTVSAMLERWSVPAAIGITTFALISSGLLG